MQHARAEDNVQFKELSEEAIARACAAGRAAPVNLDNAIQNAIAADIALLEAHLNSGKGCSVRIEQTIHQLKTKGRRYDVDRVWERNAQLQRQEAEIAMLKRAQATAA
ncbi:hypothetical protein [Neptuniibacter sp.]|uniref:hypothetical protein n=1 Tax=Neptuniibacter sp. TaxID=1962643 RepID=UPI00262EC2F7|nr:hypothetical protein [Neptuniibacter sp.]MCP4596176.1 hypothetical protein [Neptuniibacter sp.]